MPKSELRKNLTFNLVNTFFNRAIRPVLAVSQQTPVSEHHVLPPGVMPDGTTITRTSPHAVEMVAPAWTVGQNPEYVKTFPGTERMLVRLFDLNERTGIGNSSLPAQKTVDGYVAIQTKRRNELMHELQLSDAIEHKLRTRGLEDARKVWLEVIADPASSDAKRELAKQRFLALGGTSQLLLPKDAS